MDVFGSHWENHFETISTNWLEMVAPQDVVLIPGDISWAMQLAQIEEDLRAIENLPGQKIFLRGNHDYWWNAIGKVRAMLGPGSYALQNDAVMLNGLVFCGTRGWNCPGTEGFGEHDQKIYARELLRLRASLEDGKKRGAKEIIGVLHYPPTNDKHQVSGFTELMSEYGVKTCVYGHLHGKEKFRRGIKGVLNGVEYKLVSLDYLDARPLRLI
jgi:predicted phosphohydrolase